MKLLDMLKKEFDEKVVKPGELKDTNNLKILVIGESGSGKTFSYTSLPDQAGSVYVDCERGLATLSQAPDPSVIQAVKTYGFADLCDVLRKLKAMPEVKTIFIDSLTEINEWVKEEVLQKQGKDQDEMSQYEWTMLLNRLRGFIRGLKHMQKTVVLVAHTKNERDDDLGMIVKKPMVTGQLRDQLEREFDIVLYAKTGMKDKQTVYKWITEKSDRYPAKDRFGVLPKPAMDQDFATLMGLIREGGAEGTAE